MGQTGLAFAFLFENFLVCIVDRLAIALLFSIRKEGGGGEEGFLLGYFWISDAPWDFQKFKNGQRSLIFTYSNSAPLKTLKPVKKVEKNDLVLAPRVTPIPKKYFFLEFSS